MNYYIQSFTCECCGKKVETLFLEEWAYKIRQKKSKGVKDQALYFCSWKCLRKWEKDHGRSN